MLLPQPRGHDFRWNPSRLDLLIKSIVLNVSRHERIDQLPDRFARANSPAYLRCGNADLNIGREDDSAVPSPFFRSGHSFHDEWSAGDLARDLLVPRQHDEVR